MMTTKWVTALSMVALLAACKDKGKTVREGNTIKVTDGTGNSLEMVVDDKPTAPADDPTTCATGTACLEIAVKAGDNTKVSQPAFERACDLGEPLGCSLAAGVYLNGENVPKDVVRGKALAEKGCAKNDALSCDILSEVYRNGEGVPADQAKADELEKKACDATAADEDDEDLAATCSNVGVHYAEEKPVDKENARKYLERGCAIHVTQCVNLGIALADGVFGDKDPAKAREVYTKACDAGIADACSQLGLLFKRGEGGPKDLEKAKALFDQACKGGSKVGCKNVETTK